MNGFEKHGINHSSASSINMYANAPCAWVAKYLFERKFTYGFAARVGNIAEDAVVAVLTGTADLEGAIEKATEEATKVLSLTPSSADQKRLGAIRGMVTHAVDELAQYGAPDLGSATMIYGKMQHKVELTCNGDGWSLPIIGYLDLYYPDHGLIVDLKTTMRAPSNMSDEHLRQGALYRQAKSNMGVKFLYVTGSKAVWHEVPEPKNILEDVKKILNRQERMLRLDKEDIKELIPVNTSSYYWTGDEALREELYGL